MQEEMDPPLPKALGEYEVVAPLSVGGMATLYIGRVQKNPSELVALKVLSPHLEHEQEFITMFLDEARIATRLSHPNIVKMHGIGSSGPHHYLAMQLLRGHTLLELAKAAASQKQRVPFELAAWVGEQIARGLHAVHELRDQSGALEQVIHRDVNPSNIFLTYAGEPKLIDFGLARAKDRLSQTRVGIVKGKLAYLSPEQLEGKPGDRRTDIFALGVTLWELSLGRRLFRDSDDLATLKRILHEPIPDPRTLDPTYPAPLAEALLKALAKEPHLRPNTAEEFARSLALAAKGCGFVMGRSAASRYLRELFRHEEEPSLTALRPPPPKEVRLRPSEVSTPKLSFDDFLSYALHELEVGREPLPKGDAALGRLFLETSLLHELFGDRACARDMAQKSLESHRTPAAGDALRRLVPPRERTDDLWHSMLQSLPLSARHRADLLADQGRILLHQGLRHEAARRFSEALLLYPKHPASLVGLLEAKEDADSLLLLAESITGDPRLSAWLSVERAEALRSTHAPPEQVRALFAEGLSHDPSLGPVRAACIEHALRNDDFEWLATLWMDEAALTRERCAVPLLFAALVLEYRKHETREAFELLCRAKAQPEKSPLLSRVILDELILSAERLGKTVETIALRRERLPLLQPAGARFCETLSIAHLCMVADKKDEAIVALRHARTLRPDDPQTFLRLDKALAQAKRLEERAELHREEGERSRGLRASAHCFQAAQLYDALGRRRDAMVVLRSALQQNPGDETIADALMELLSERVRTDAPDPVRERIMVHLVTAAHAKDRHRTRIELEAAANLQGDLLGDAAGAVCSYERLVALFPDDLGLWAGLLRFARRARRHDLVTHALREQVRLLPEEDSKAYRRKLLAEELGRTDPDLAIALLSEFQVPGRHDLLSTLLYQTGRFEELARFLETSVNAHEPTAAAKELCRVASLYWGELRAPMRARPVLERALALAPNDDDVRAELVRVAEAIPDRDDAYLLLREMDPDPSLGVHLAVFEDHVLMDRANARRRVQALRKAHPEETWLLQLELSIALRENDTEALSHLLAEQAHLDHGSGAAVMLARHLLAQKAPLESIVATLDDAREKDPHGVSSLYCLRHAARGAKSAPLLANAYAAEAEIVSSPQAKLCALWGELGTLLFELPGADAARVAEEILALDPEDRAAEDVLLCHASERVRSGDLVSRDRWLRRMRRAREGASDRGFFALAEGLVLASGSPSDPDGARAAFREAHAAHPTSVLAAWGLVYSGSLLSDPESCALGFEALARMTKDKERRAARLVDAASFALASHEGSVEERLEHVCLLCEEALLDNPNLALAMDLLTDASLRLGREERLVLALESALRSAHENEAIVRAALTLGRLLHHDPAGAPLALSLLELASEKTTSLPVLHLLSDMYQTRSDPDGAKRTLLRLRTLEEPPEEQARTALALASLEETAFGKDEEALSILRAAHKLFPTHVEVMREFLRLLRKTGDTSSDVGSLLLLLGVHDTSAEARGAALYDLAELLEAEGETVLAEIALTEAEAQTASGAFLDKLLSGSESDPQRAAALLEILVRRGEELAKPHASALARLGVLYAESLGRLAEGAKCLQDAVTLSPAMHEVRASLGRTLLRAERTQEAISVLLSMLVPNPSPLLSLREPDEVLQSLESVYGSTWQTEEATIVRELRVLSGGLSDADAMALRARRLPEGSPDGSEGALGAEVLLRTLAAEVGTVLSVFSALTGIDTHLVSTELVSLGLSSKKRLRGKVPLLTLGSRLSYLFGIDAPPILVGDGSVRPRTLLVDNAAWILVPETLLWASPPLQIAELSRPLVRIALGLSWMDELPLVYSHALFLAAARTVVSGYGAGAREDAPDDLVSEASRRLERHLGRRQRKALGLLRQALMANPVVTRKAVSDALYAVELTELRAAFVLSGDLLSVWDTLPKTAAPPPNGARALLSVLTDARAQALLQFALSPKSNELRIRLRTLWGRSGLLPATGMGDRMQGPTMPPAVPR